MVAVLALPSLSIMLPNGEKEERDCLSEVEVSKRAQEFNRRTDAQEKQTRNRARVRVHRITSHLLRFALGERRLVDLGLGLMTLVIASGKCHSWLSTTSRVLPVSFSMARR